MFRSIFLSLILFFIVSSAWTDIESYQIDKNLKIREIRPDLFIVIHAYPWPANSLIAVMDNGDILIVDTPYSPKAMEDELNWITKKFGKRNIQAINTHFHVDRLGGNEALVKANIPIYGSDLTLNEISNKGQRSILQTASWVKDENLRNYYLNFKYFAPTKIFDAKNGLTLKYGGEKAIVKYYGAGHSVDNLVVYLPEKKVLFAGCMIIAKENESIGNTSDGDIFEWKNTISKINTNNIDLVIPGHGETGGIDLISHTLDLVEREIQRKSKGDSK